MILLDILFALYWQMYFSDLRVNRYEVVLPVVRLIPRETGKEREFFTVDVNGNAIEYYRLLERQNLLAKEHETRP